MCDTTTGQGSVEMIRKTLDGSIERFEVEGGRVINEAGSWAYQVPMNLDYVVTDEFGDLQKSQDPNKGIPTRASVRFRVGMDETGGSGRLRTRAKYLIPHNPSDADDVDYTFDENTSDNHFRDMYWNKIYTITNFIPRVQPNDNAQNRNMTGIKDVDDCTGAKTPFPYNRVDTDLNPLFTILCLIISLIIRIVNVVNGVVIRIINTILTTLNAVLKVVCSVMFTIGRLVCGLKFAGESCRRNACIAKKADGSVDCSGSCNAGDCNCKEVVSYVACITMDCEGELYAPGCKEGTKGI